MEHSRDHRSPQGDLQSESGSHRTLLMTCAIRQRHPWALPATTTSTPYAAAGSRGAGSDDASLHRACRIIRKRYGSATASNSSPYRAEQSLISRRRLRESRQTVARQADGAVEPLTARIRHQIECSRIDRTPHPRTHRNARGRSMQQCCGAATSLQPSRYRESEPIACSRRDWRHSTASQDDRTAASFAQPVGAARAVPHREVRAGAASSSLSRGIGQSMRSALEKHGGCRALPRRQPTSQRRRVAAPDAI